MMPLGDDPKTLLCPLANFVIPWFPLMDYMTHLTVLTWYMFCSTFHSRGLIYSCIIFLDLPHELMGVGPITVDRRPFELLVLGFRMLTFLLSMGY